MQKNNQKGVTLLELIIVMVIIAIGAVLVAPNIGAWIPHYRLRGATRDIVSTMRTAQMKAVSQNMRYQVSFTPGTGENGSYILQRDSGGFINDGPMQLLPRGITMGTTLQNNNAIFNPDSTSSTGSVILSNAKAQKRILLTATTGRVKIE
ncbi:MAG: prepilin-type N-terminal cleavage/methylation domain-containing protein [Deltaproteobacteria bacterium]|nr:prepilin-type N-terminal cleavage/methylation domain-containing protein [Deltaproteobacteria bacterium]